MSRRNESILHRGSYLSQLERTSSRGVREMFSFFSKVYENVDSSDFYYYKQEQDIEPENTPHLPDELFNIFYSEAVTDAKRFSYAQAVLLELGQDLSPTPAPAELISVGKRILESCYVLVPAFNKINATPLTPLKNMGMMKSIWQRQFARLQAEVGTHKEETFRETVRRFIPRWMTHLLSVPQLAQEQEQQQLAELWTAYTSEDVNLLVHPSNIEKGAPIHRVLQLTEVLENQETAYHIKTDAILQILEFEKNKHQSFTEIPFFQYVFGSMLLANSGTTPKNAYFDFKSSLSKVISETYSHLQQELTSQTPGKATEFLAKISAYYPEHFSELITYSLFQYENISNDFDALELLTNLQKSDTAWLGDLTKQIELVQNRRFINSDEFRAYISAESLETQGSHTNLGDFISNVQTVINGDDIVSFKVDLQKLGYTSISKKAYVSLDLESGIETIFVQLYFSSENTTRELGFSMSFSGEEESIDFDFIQEEQHIVALCRDIVSAALKHQANVVTTQRKKLQPLQKGKEVTVFNLPESTIAVAQLTREERIEQYAETKKRNERKRGKSTARPQVSPQPKFNEDLLVAQEPEIQVVGLNQATIQELLDLEGIEVVEAEAIIEKVQYLVSTAEQSRRMIGKRVEVDLFGKDISHFLNLRQINWIFEGSAIRIYLEDMGNAVFAVRGILNKKGESMQHRYIGKLIKRIFDQRNKE
jgi:DNA uptake protein ComE-like DNA-binding protein